MLNAFGLKINTLATFDEAWARCQKSKSAQLASYEKLFDCFTTKEHPVSLEAGVWIFVNMDGYAELRKKAIDFFDYSTSLQGPHRGTHGDYLGYPVFSDIDLPPDPFKLTKAYIASQKSIIPAPFVIMSCLQG